MKLVDFEFDRDVTFPHPLLSSGDSPLAAGGDLSLQRLLMAYGHGFFPWYSESEPILWWYTHPRAVIYPSSFNIPKSLKKLLKNNSWQVSYNEDFPQVIKKCASQNRKNQTGTWINRDMVLAYTQLHQSGWAHSTEVWNNDQLIGGLYGILIGKIFYGESMFSEIQGASKIALVLTIQNLIKNGIQLIDCQQNTDHMKMFGTQLISANIFYEHLKNNRCASRCQFSPD